MRPRRLKRALRLSIVAGLFAGLASAVGACGGDDDDDSSGGHAGTSGIVLVGGSGGSSAGGTATSADAGEPTTGSGAEGGNEPAIGGSLAGGSSAGGSSAGSPSGGSNGLYLPCASLADCKQYGGGKICCSTPNMRFCTKQSACSGDVLP